MRQSQKKILINNIMAFVLVVCGVVVGRQKVTR